MIGSLLGFMIILGAASTVAFIVTGIMLQNYRLELGPWPMLSLLTACCTIGILLVGRFDNQLMAEILFLSMFIFLISIKKFWETIRLAA